METSEEQPERAEYARVPYDDHPERCIGMTSLGQCKIFRIPGSDKCKVHDKGWTERHKAEANLSQYRVSKYRARIEQLGTHEKALTLRDELGIARMMLETKLNRYQEPNDLEIHSPAIIQLLDKIEKLVGSCKRLESSLGQTLDREAILRLSDELVGIISAHVPEETRAKVADDIFAAVSGAIAKRDASQE